MTLISVTAVVLILFAQWAAGAVLWRFIRRKPIGIIELLGMGLALGTIMATISSAIFRTSLLGKWSWFVPTAAALLAIAVWIFRNRRVGVSSFVTQGDAGALIAVPLGLVVGLIPLLVNWRRVPLAQVTDESFLDVYFLEALTRGLSQFGPGESVLMTGGTIRYHWLSYIWAGDIASFADLPSFAAITRVLPIVALVGTVTIAATWAAWLARGRAGNRWIPSVAVLLVVAGGYTGALYGTILNFDSPSQAFTTMWLLALLFTVAIYLDRGSPWTLAALALLGAANTGGKVSHIAVAAGALLLLSAVGVLARKPWWARAFAATAVTGLAALVTYGLVIFGAAVDRNLTEDLAVKASTWQGLDPLPGTWGVAAGTVAFLLAAYARMAGIGWMFRERELRMSPSVVMSVGAIAVGTSAIIVLAEGINETWFLLAASAPASVISAVGAVGAALWLKRLGTSSVVATAGIAVGVSVVSLFLSTDPPDEGSTGFARWGAAVTPWILAPLLSTVWFVWLDRRNIRRETWISILAAGVIVLVASSILTRPATLWTSARQVVTEVGVMQPSAITSPPSPDATAGPATFTDRVLAAGWLEQKADISDIVATSDDTSAFIPAYTGLRMFLAGSRYQVGLGNASDINEIDRRASVISDLRDGSPEELERAIAELCAASVRWLWWEGSPPTRLTNFVVKPRGAVNVIDLAPICGSSDAA